MWHYATMEGIHDRMRPGLFVSHPLLSCQRDPWPSYVRLIDNFTYLQPGGLVRKALHSGGLCVLFRMI